MTNVIYISDRVKFKAQTESNNKKYQLKHDIYLCKNEKDTLEHELQLQLSSSQYKKFVDGVDILKVSKSYKRRQMMSRLNVLVHELQRMNSELKRIEWPNLLLEG